MTPPGPGNHRVSAVPLFAEPHQSVQASFLRGGGIYLLQASAGLFKILARLVVPLAYPVCLRGPRLRPRVRDVLKLKIQRVFVVLPVPAVLAAPVGKHPQKRDPVRVEERDHL